MGPKSWFSSRLRMRIEMGMNGERKPTTSELGRIYSMAMDCKNLQFQEGLIQISDVHAVTPPMTLGKEFTPNPMPTNLAPPTYCSSTGQESCVSNLRFLPVLYSMTEALRDDSFLQLPS
ncbi:hypothetical protein ACH5RR_008316 [Cinchona calisaya]|uniref:Uncharacterized protein n=1 Tax=Cinchona calisaya TaxID=153742 RepID=A0ABD3ACS8_9GENT